MSLNGIVNHTNKEKNIPTTTNKTNKISDYFQFNIKVHKKKSNNIMSQTREMTAGEHEHEKREREGKNELKIRQDSTVSDFQSDNSCIYST